MSWLLPNSLLDFGILVVPLCLPAFFGKPRYIIYSFVFSIPFQQRIFNLGPIRYNYVYITLAIGILAFFKGVIFDRKEIRLNFPCIIWLALMLVWLCLTIFWSRFPFVVLEKLLQFVAVSVGILALANAFVWEAKDIRIVINSLRLFAVESLVLSGTTLLAISRLIVERPFDSIFDFRFDIWKGELFVSANHYSTYLVIAMLCSFYCLIRKKQILYFVCLISNAILILVLCSRGALYSLFFAVTVLIALYYKLIWKYCFDASKRLIEFQHFFHFLVWCVVIVSIVAIVYLKIQPSKTIAQWPEQFYQRLFLKKSIFKAPSFKINELIIANKYALGRGEPAPWKVMPSRLAEKKGIYRLNPYLISWREIVPYRSVMMLKRMLKKSPRYSILKGEFNLADPQSYIKGTGLGTFVLENPRGLYAHNTYLGLWKETGMPGILFYLIFLGDLIIKSIVFLIRNRHAAWVDQFLGVTIFLGFISYLIAAFSHDTFFAPQNWLFVAFLIFLFDKAGRLSLAR